MDAKHTLTMKRIILLTFIFVSGLSTQAQVRFGVKAGYNHTSVKMDVGFYLQGLNYSAVPGIHAGLLMDAAIGEHFSIQPALLYSSRGFNSDGYVPGPADGPVDAHIETRYHYMELPLNFLFKYPLGPGKVFAGVGPVISYGIKGRVNGAYMDYAAPEEKVFFLDKQRDFDAAIKHKQYLRPFNAAAGFILGYELHAGVLISGSYHLGLTDVEPHPWLSQKSRIWGVSVGYLFGGMD